jgi:hypothetical protein
MKNKLKPSKVYIVLNLNNVGGEKNYTTKEDLKIYLSTSQKMTSVTM